MRDKSFDFVKLDNLLMTKYQARKITKLQFRDSLIGPNRDDYGDNICDLTENIICSDNVVFYLIDDVDVINANCRCLYKYMHPSGHVLPYPTGTFYSYILFVVELSADKKKVVSYARWGSFADNIFEEMAKIGLI